MLGAIIGDICGSAYESHNVKNENISLFGKYARPTDDSVMTAAVGRALIDTEGYSEKSIENALIDSMHYYGNVFPFAGYGGRFKSWIQGRQREPYYSLGNGSAMRVSSVGWLYDSLGKTLEMAKLTARVTHNHPEGIRGAEAIAACIYLARTGKTKEEIREYVDRNFYLMDFTLDEIRNSYLFDVRCEGSVPQAIEAFLEGEDFEDVIRKAISIGGDSDTIAAMAGSIAEAYFGIPQWMADKAIGIMRTIGNKHKHQNYSILEDEVLKFRRYLTESGMTVPVILPSDSKSMERELKNALDKFEYDRTEENYLGILTVLLGMYLWVPCTTVLSDVDQEEIEKMAYGKEENLESLIGETFTSNDGIRLVPELLISDDEIFFPVFSSEEEMDEYGNDKSKIEMSFYDALRMASDNENRPSGIVVNPFSDNYIIGSEVFDKILETENAEEGK